jgi:hypothetical protein
MYINSQYSTFIPISNLTIITIYQFRLIIIKFYVGIFVFFINFINFSYFFIAILVIVCIVNFFIFINFRIMLYGFRLEK